MSPRATHRQALAQLAAALVLGSGTAALAGACGEELATVPVPSDGGGDTGSVSLADCPKVEPREGAECALPEGTTCDFGQCGTRLARCSRGVWRLGSNSPPSPPCPEDPPNPDVPCPACWPAAISCPYGSSDCSQADASDKTAIASCPNGTWILDVRPCQDGGGPDVQGPGDGG